MGDRKAVCRRGGDGGGREGGHKKAVCPVILFVRIVASRSLL